MSVLLIVNSPPYGTEGPYNAFRLAEALALRDEHVELFLMGDAVAAARAGQDPRGAHASLEQMLAGLLEKGVDVNCCGTCCATRGLAEEQLVAHARGHHPRSSPSRLSAATGSSSGGGRRPACWCSGSSACVADAVAGNGALCAGERALLLLSGGADSMALFALVRAADRRLGLGLALAALHVDYGLRGAESDRDRLIVERACAAAGVPLHVERLGGRLAGRDFQARARVQRYGRARQLAADHGYGVIVTAHNRDDQAETVLYRLAKYASPRALAGMRPRDGDLARPLLGVGATEIREYCRAAGVEYGDDATNAAPLYARNVLRLEAPPRLEELNPRFSETLAATAEQAAAEAEVLTAAASEARRRLEAPRGRGRPRRRRRRCAWRRGRPCARSSSMTCCAGPWAARRSSSDVWSRRCCGSRSAPTTPAASASAAASRRCAAAACCASAPSPPPTPARRRCSTGR